MDFYFSMCQQYVETEILVDTSLNINISAYLFPLLFYNILTSCTVRQWHFFVFGFHRRTFIIWKHPKQQRYQSKCTSILNYKSNGLPPKLNTRIFLFYTFLDQFFKSKIVVETKNINCYIPKKSERIFWQTEKTCSFQDFL